MKHPKARKLVEKLLESPAEYEYDDAINDLESEEVQELFNKATAKFRAKNRLLMLSDASGDGTTSTTVGVWHDHRGQPLRDGAVIDLWSGSEGAHSGSWYVPNPDASCELPDSDGSVDKYGDWTVTEQDLENLCAAAMKPTGDYTPDDDSITGEQVQLIRQHKAEILSALNRQA